MRIGIVPLSDLRAVRGFLSSPTCLAMMDTPIALLFILIIFAMNALLGTFVVAAGIAMLAVGYFTERKTKPPLTEDDKDE